VASLTVNELVQMVWNRLDNNMTYYSKEEVILNGINPAQRLLVLFKPELLQQRVSVSVSKDQAFIDLREVAPRAWRINRLVLGTIPGVSASGGGGTEVTYDDKQALKRMSLSQLAWRRTWFRERGKIRGYYSVGRFRIGLYKRPAEARTLSLVYSAMPTAFTINDLASTPDIAETHHAQLADMAAALLLMKEGIVEMDKARRMLEIVLGRESVGPLRGVIARLQHSIPSEEPAVAAGGTL